MLPVMTMAMRILTHPNHLLGSYSDNDNTAPSSLSTTTPATLIRRRRGLLSSIASSLKKVVAVAVAVVKAVMKEVVEEGLKAFGLYNALIKKESTFGINIQLGASLSITFGLSFNTAASITTGLSYSKSAKLGVQYANGKIGSLGQFDPATHEFHKPTVSVELTSSLQLGFAVAVTLTLEFVASGSLNLNPYLSYDITVGQNSEDKQRYDATGVLSIHFDITAEATLGIVIKGVSIVSRYIGSDSVSPQILSTLVPVKGSSANSGVKAISLSPNQAEFAFSTNRIDYEAPT
ncbi:unnamed protein product [Didymodactylos carnosus]|uniref:Uncharacterized protein n=1 Tax=Didymodactylos carnosus TaxID=1234261 RepID=A0A8S2CMG8_9BILA|nr:unnamed protein product [Didymodactylos carnosus]CAF3529090.1 unnamed protein product [Didymodactylos carnosus]